MGQGAILPRQDSLDGAQNGLNRADSAASAAGDFLERGEVGLHLIEPTAGALAVLLDEARQAPAGNGAGGQYQAIQQSAQRRPSRNGP